MTLIQQLLLYGLLALGIFVLVDGLFYLWGNIHDRGEGRIKRRLEQDKQEHMASYHALKKKHEDPEDLSIDRYFKGLLLHADSSLNLKKIYVIIAVLSVAFIALLQIFLPVLPFMLAVLTAIALGFIFPILYLKRAIAQRISHFEDHFPDALELVVRNLRIGRPLNTAIKAVADEVPDPVGKEFHHVAQDVAYGKNLPDAVDDMLKRISTPSLQFFVVAVQIQYESGGNLAEVLEGLSTIIRGRFRLMRKVNALTAEGRFSAWFLSLFPFFMMFIMNMINPGYYMQVSDHPFFTQLIGIVVIMLGINVVAMRIITNLKI